MQRVAVAPKKVLSAMEKYRIVAEKIKRLTGLVAEAPMRLFEERLDVVCKLNAIWEANGHVLLQQYQCNDAENLVCKTCKNTNCMRLDSLRHLYK